MSTETLARTWRDICISLVCLIFAVTELYSVLPKKYNITPTVGQVCSWDAGKLNCRFS